MKRLYLLRHGKAARNEIPDLERPLTKRGRKDAALVGSWLARKSRSPDAVLCSPSSRTMETWKKLGEKLKDVREPRVLKSLYNARPSMLLARIRSVPDTVESLLVIGHNPGLQDLAIRLAAPDSKKRVLEKVVGKWPTAAMAVFELDAKSWRDLGESGARLVRVVEPKDLR